MPPAPEKSSREASTMHATGIMPACQSHAGRLSSIHDGDHPKSSLLSLLRDRSLRAARYACSLTRAIMMLSLFVLTARGGSGLWRGVIEAAMVVLDYPHTGCS